MGKMQIPLGCQGSGSWNAGFGGAKTLANIPSILPVVINISGSMSHSLQTGNDTTGLHLFKGALPTQAQVDTITTSVIALTSLFRYSDLLVSFISSGWDLATSGSQLRIPLNSGVARASGTASWFMLYTSYGSKPAYAMIGSVDLVGSESAIQLATVDIVAGRLYKFPVFNFNFTTSFSW